MLVFITTNSASSSSNYLYNLDDDPYESTNVIDKSSYSSIVTKMTKLHESFASSVVKPTEISQSTRDAGWTKCGGVCSFMDKGAGKVKKSEKTNDKETNKRRQLRHKSSSSSSSSSFPNIVFVLVDDWGYNDVGYRSSYLSWTTPTIDKLASEGIKLENYYTSYYCMPARRYDTRTRFLVSYPSSPLALSPHSYDQQTQLTTLSFIFLLTFFFNTQIPVRSSLMTGRYAFRTGMWDSDYESGRLLDTITFDSHSVVMLSISSG